MVTQRQITPILDQHQRPRTAPTGGGLIPEQRSSAIPQPVPIARGLRKGALGLVFGLLGAIGLGCGSDGSQSTNRENLVAHQTPRWHWPMNEGSGLTVSNVTKTGNDGKLENGPKWLDDATLSLDGIDDYVDVGNLIVSGRALTIAAWFKVADLQGCAARECRIISKAKGVRSQEHIFMVSLIERNGSARLRFRLKTDGMTSTLVSFSGGIPANEWTHVAAVYDGSTMRIYSDGIEVGRMAKSGDVTNDAGAGCWIGGNPPGPTDRPWNGQIKDVRIYERSLPANEIQGLVSQDNQPPLAVASADVTSGADPLTVRFDGSGSSDPDSAVISYRWDFGDGTTSDEVRPTHTFAGHGQYSVRLTVTDEANASATSSVITINVTHDHEDGDDGHGGSDGGDHGDGSHDHGDALPHQDDLNKQVEHLALFELVHREDATHIASTSGNWSESATWKGGVVPGDNARVWIPEDINVTFAHQDPSRFLSVRVDGTLRFAPGQDTLMQVDSLVVDASGLLEVGTLDAPIRAGRVARILITDRGPIDTGWDPLLLSRGVITHGTASFVGESKTSFVIAAENPRAGDNVLELDKTPLNWRAGDRLLIPGVRKPTATRDEDEVISIKSIQGTSVTLSRALSYDHSTVRADLQKVPVANMDRNVVIESENRAEPSRAGHVMFMHSNKAMVQYARFFHMGRNNKSIPTTDPRLDEDGNLVASTGANARGRYAVHFHRSGVNGVAVLVKGCVVENNPGWGYVNHDSHVLFEDNVAYNTAGSGFVTEIGNEVGAFLRNLSVRSKITTRTIEFGGSDRDEKNGFGSEGHGFWMQSPGVELIDNIASGHGQEAFFFHGAFRDQDRTHYEFDIDKVMMPGVVTNRGAIRGSLIKAQKVPLKAVRGNHAFGSGKGYSIRWRRRPDAPLSGAGGDLIEDFQIWNVQWKGISIGYSSGMIFRNGVILGDIDNPIPLSSSELNNPVVLAGEEEGLTGRGISSNGNVHSVRYENIDIEGFTIGVQATSGNDTGLKNLVLRNVINLRVLTPQDTGVSSEKTYYGRTVYATGIVNLPLSSTALRGATQHNVYMMKQLQRTGIAGGGTVDQEFKNYTAPDKVYYNGKRLYYYEQAAQAIPFPSDDPPFVSQPKLKDKFIADFTAKYGDYFDKTNATLMSRYGRTLGGAVASAGAVDGASQGIFGLVEENVPMPAPRTPEEMHVAEPEAGSVHRRGASVTIAWTSTGFSADTVWEIGLSSDDGKFYRIGLSSYASSGRMTLIHRDPSDDMGTHVWSFEMSDFGRIAKYNAGSVAPGKYSMTIGPRYHPNDRVGFIPDITVE